MKAGAVNGRVPIVRCTGLTKRYGRTRALVGLDLTLEPGAPIALVGPNGAGKTTLLSLLAGFARPSGGEVRVLGERPGAAALVGRLGALPQDARFDPRLGIGRQLALLAALQGLDRRAARAEVARVLEVVGLGDVARQRPTTLSHGMRKRVALAQSLLGEPELVLLDEPTAGIDPENARAIRELIARRDARTTFLVSSHNLDELERMCGSVVQLERGALVRHESLVDGGGSGSVGPAARTSGSRFDDGPQGPGRAPGGHESSGTERRAPPELTIRLGDVPEAAFSAAVGALPTVREARRLADGDWRLRVSDETEAARTLLALLAERGWTWRHLVRGRSLEERLYGDR